MAEVARSSMGRVEHLPTHSAPGAAFGGAASGSMRTFLVVWFGQLASLLGSGLSRFALGVWTYQRTESATAFALVLVFSTVPAILVSPFAGALVDRWRRRRALIWGNVGSALSTFAVVLLLALDRLELWHVYVSVGCSAIASAFHRSAFEAATALLVPQRHLARAGGLVQFAQAAARVLSPLIAGALILTIRLEGVLLVDIASFLVALLSLLVAHIPDPPGGGPEPGSASPSLWREAAFGWRYISARGGLLGLLAFLAVLNFSLGLVQALLTPLVLSFSSARDLGAILSAGGFGMLAGGALMGLWGGPRRRITGLLGPAIGFGGFMVLLGWAPSVGLLTVASFGMSFCASIIISCNQAIWQARTSPEVQGRVFATRTMISWASAPLAYLLAGPLADHVFEPLLVSGGWWSRLAVTVVGAEPGRGIGLLFVCAGAAVVAATAGAWLLPAVRLVEENLPGAGGLEPTGRQSST